MEESTLDKWRKAQPDFSAAYEAGGEAADAEVALALKHRAMGYSHKAEKIMLGPGGIVLREEYIEHYPPDTAAASLWLSNRQRGRWKLKPDEETNANVNIKITGGLPDE